MKIKLDENLPIRLMSMLKSLGHGVRTVGEEDLTGRADFEIWEAAQKEDRFLITRIWIFPTCGDSLPGHTTAFYWSVCVRQTGET